MNSITKYKPWKGFSLIFIGILLDFTLGRTGIVFIISLFVMYVWALGLK